MKKIKSVKAWAIWNSSINEPWGAMIETGNGVLFSYALFEKKVQAIKYRERGWHSPRIKKQQKLVKVLITPQ